MVLCGTVLAMLAACARAQEPVIGGPCEGCELVFAGMPAEIGPTARIAPEGEPGEAMRIEGVVRTPDGRPAAGVVVYAYHTDAGGVYPRAATRHGRLRGWSRTGADGRYLFTTIRPGPYPGRSTPEHVHMHVVEPGRATYWIDDIVFTDDALLTPERRREMSRGRGGPGVATPRREPDGAWVVRRDIVLGREVPGWPSRHVER